MRYQTLLKMTLTDRLYSIGDRIYAEFQAKLIPGETAESFIGVRVPELRKLAKEYCGTKEAAEFLDRLPHSTCDENILHGILVSEIKDYRECVSAVDTFLPYVGNWAVCDTMTPKVFGKNRDKLPAEIKKWIASEHTYTRRFGLRMLMCHYLDGDFRKEYLDIAADVRSEEYYVNMMTAWFFATALAKQWDAAIPYLENGRLDDWAHNKTIQKARESYRISPPRKEYLKTLKR